MKCANCASEALYVYEPARNTATGYCGLHLPRFLRDRAAAGLLPTTADFEKEQMAALEALNAAAVTVEEAPARKRKAKTEAEEPVIDVPAEEPIVEEAVSDEADS